MLVIYPFVQKIFRKGVMISSVKADKGGSNMEKRHFISSATPIWTQVWLWNMEEGISAALSTFHTAADFCENYDGFVFNHNEALLYQWIEEYDLPLFERIQKLVKAGKWHIMGGWYLQPDCNMPSGESFVRQIRSGQEYFREKFGVTPKTVINFDPFGHSRGLVQILKKAGYHSYLFGRPSEGDCPLGGDNIIWEGFDGSQILGHRTREGYNSLMGEAGKKVREKLEALQRTGAHRSHPHSGAWETTAAALPPGYGGYRETHGK